MPEYFIVGVAPSTDVILVPRGVSMKEVTPDGKPPRAPRNHFDVCALRARPDELEIVHNAS